MRLAKAAGARYARTYRVEVVYELRHERAFLAEIDDLLSNPSRWTALPPGACTSELNCLAFRSLDSTAGVVVDQLMGADAVGYPHTLNAMFFFHRSRRKPTAADAHISHSRAETRASRRELALLAGWPGKSIRDGMN